MLFEQMKFCRNVLNVLNSLATLVSLTLWPEDQRLSPIDQWVLARTDMSCPLDVLEAILSDIADDILHFGWLRQIVRDAYPRLKVADVSDIVVAAVKELERCHVIVVGDAREIDGKVQILTWNVSGDELEKRMRFVIDKAENAVGSSFCFWIQSSSDVAT